MACSRFRRPLPPTLQKGEQFQEFCRIAMEAYKELRRNAALIMSLLRLMKDAGIEVLPCACH